MRKQLDTVQQFTALRSALVREREAIRQRLQQIEAALAGARKAPTPSSSKMVGVLPGARPRPGNKMSIREAITKVTTSRALTVREIVEAVRKIGYKFASRDPVNSVGAYLYAKHGRRHFKRVNGKFSPVK